jgi:hypothetical protein
MAAQHSLAPDGCADKRWPVREVRPAQPQVKRAVRLGVVKPRSARQGRKAHRQPRRRGPASVAVTRPAGRRGSGGGGGAVGGRPGGVAEPVCAVGPPNLRSSRPPERAVAQVTGSRPAAAEQGR